ncbi:protease complex subunit PrcB family protein [Candidatus Woesearchaeota archaeon]|nr:protease complex subunit PrcB family protein [Candidatus Woesearchaeota archaeon]
MVTKELKLEEISKDIYSGHNWGEYYVITDFITWNNLWRTTHSKTLPMPELPEVDFSTEMIFAVYFGETKRSGRNISIEKVLETDKELVVSVIHSYPDPEEQTAAVLTAPYHIVKTQKVDKEVTYDRIISRPEID